MWLHDGMHQKQNIKPIWVIEVYTIYLFLFFNLYYLFIVTREYHNAFLFEFSPSQYNPLLNFKWLPTFWRNGSPSLTWHFLVMVITWTKLCSVTTEKATIDIFAATVFLNRSTNIFGIFHISHIMFHCIVPFYILSFLCTLFWQLVPEHYCSLHYLLFSGCSNVIPQRPLWLPCISINFSILR
jgi:hypothetical protein